MTRLETWEGDLSKGFDVAEVEPFAWGTHDCAQFACRLIKVMTGINPAESLLGTYGTRLEAEAVLLEFAGGGLEEAAEKITTEQNMPEVGLGFAQRGDVVLMDTDSGPALGIVSLNGYQAVFLGLEGFIRVRVMSCRRAWRVG